MSELIAAKGVIFRETRSGEYLIDWHNAPRRQFVVNLTGEGEIEVSDGGKRSMFHSFTRVGDIRRRNSSCWRRTRFSASSHARLVNLGRKASSSWIRNATIGASITMGHGRVISDEVFRRYRYFRP